MRVPISSSFLFAAAVCLHAPASLVETAIPLADVPAPVLAAASAAVEHIVITEAERVGDGVYELEGRAGGVEYEIHVSPAGEVLGVERDDD